MNKDFYSAVNDRIRSPLQSRTHRFENQDLATMVGTIDGQLTPAAKQRDLNLAQKDARRWCLDRCLATGYCDAVEDLWDMSTQQVQQFCQKCANLEGCELDYELA